LLPLLLLLLLLRRALVGGLLVAGLGRLLFLLVAHNKSPC
jgi:hypothetical protein